MSKATNKKQKVSGNSTGVDPTKVLIDLKSDDEDVVIGAIRKVQGGISLCKYSRCFRVLIQKGTNLIN